MNKSEQNRVVAWRLKLLRQASEMPRGVAQTCRRFGLSRKTFYKWRARYKSHGEGGLCDRPRAPLHSPRATSRTVISKILYLRERCREQEVCRLRWDYEVKVPELDTSAFVIPKDYVKNGEERLVVLNRVARSVVESLRGLHPTHVFVRVLPKGRPQPVTKMYNTAWKSARERAAQKWAERYREPAPEGFRKVRVHDLKHTFGRRLRAAGVSFEDRQDLLGHKSGRITTHYSQAELSNLIAAADKVCDTESRKSPATSWLRHRASA